MTQAATVTAARAAAAMTTPMMTSRRMASGWCRAGGRCSTGSAAAASRARASGGRRTALPRPQRCPRRSSRLRMCSLRLLRCRGRRLRPRLRLSQRRSGGAKKPTPLLLRPPAPLMPPSPWLLPCRCWRTTRRREDAPRCARCRRAWRRRCGEFSRAVPPRPPASRSRLQRHPGAAQPPSLLLLVVAQTTETMMTWQTMRRTAPLRKRHHLREAWHRTQQPQTATSGRAARWPAAVAARR